MRIQNGILVRDEVVPMTRPVHGRTIDSAQERRRTAGGALSTLDADAVQSSLAAIRRRAVEAAARAKTRDEFWARQDPAQNGSAPVANLAAMNKRAAEFWA